MDSIDARLATLLAIPDRDPDLFFANEVGLRLTVERKFIARLALERARTATLLVSTISLAIGLWLYAKAGVSAAAFEAAGDSIIGLASAAVMLLWLGTGATGALASD